MTSEKTLLSYYSGCGNSFCIIDNRENVLPKEKEQISKLCHLERGVDGLIYIGKSQKADFSMLFFNNDGSPAAMCGNGIRCCAKYVIDKLHFPHNVITIEIGGRILEVKKQNNLFEVDMGQIVELKKPITLAYEGKTYTVYLVNSGVEHAVIFLPDIEKVDVVKMGAFFRHHPNFSPHGANVNFVDPKKLTIRTYERGVEAETLACGTGCVAAAYLLSKYYRLPSPITLTVRSQESLQVTIAQDCATLLGPAVWHEDKEITYATK